MKITALAFIYLAACHPQASPNDATSSSGMDQAVWRAAIGQCAVSCSCTGCDISVCAQATHDAYCGQHSCAGDYLKEDTQQECIDNEQLTGCTPDTPPFCL
jgi:hypothetical protein